MTFIKIAECLSSISRTIFPFSTHSLPPLYHHHHHHCHHLNLHHHHHHHHQQHHHHHHEVHVNPCDISIGRYINNQCVCVPVCVCVCVGACVFLYVWLSLFKTLFYSSPSKLAQVSSGSLVKIVWCSLMHAEIQMKIVPKCTERITLSRHIMKHMI